MVDVAKIKEVRERTGVGFGDCKKALEESDWDIEGALDVLRKQSAVKAAKRADRTASEGRLGLKVSDDGTVGAIVEVNSETDFAARNERFAQFCDRAVDAVIADGPEAISELEDERNVLISAIGENISIRRADRIASKEGFVTGYLHATGTVGAIVELSSNAGELCRNIAMHVTAQNPLVVTEDELPQEVIDREMAIFQSQIEESGRPAKFAENILHGKMAKFKAESCLNEQSYIWDKDQRVGALLKANGAECRKFVRYEVGEGIS